MYIVNISGCQETEAEPLELTEIVELRVIVELPVILD